METRGVLKGVMPGEKREVVSLDRVARAILANQNDVLASQAQEGSDAYERYSRRARALRWGFVTEYDDCLDLRPEVDIEVCEETLAVLRLFRHVEHMVSSLGMERGKAYLDAGLRFSGFDSADPHYGYMRYLVEGGDWPEFSDRKLDYPFPMSMDKYRRMIGRFEEIQQGPELTVNEVLDALLASIGAKVEQG